MRRKFIILFLFPILLVLILGSLIFYTSSKPSSYLSNSQRQLSDPLYVNKDPSDKIVILEIDDKSLQEIGAWPWNREIFAAVIDKLSQENTRIIGFDVVFAENREGDEKFIVSLQNTKTDVVFASKVVEGELLLPLESLRQTENVTYGYANFVPDKDGKVRYAKIMDEIGGTCHASLSYQILRTYFLDNSEIDCNAESAKLGFSKFNIDENGIRINYNKVNGRYTSVSLVDLINGNYPEGIFKDKVVLVGSTAQDIKLGLNDNLVSPDGSVIPGVEIHANTLQTVIEKEFLYDVSPFVSSFILLVLVSIIYFISIKWRMVYSAFFAGFILIVYLLFTVIAFDSGYVLDLIFTPLGIFFIWLAASGFKYYMKSVQEREIRRAFSQYVNRDLLAQILEDPSKLKLGGDEKQMTVFFSDIRSFTSISEKMTPEELISFVNKYLDKAASVILKNNGVIDKFIGDAVMAFWGAPIEDSNHAFNACKAAIDLIKRVEEFNKEVELKTKIHVGVGVNTGKMVVGNLGSQNRFDYTVLGDNVNLGSRLEGLTKKYGVAIIASQFTVEALSSEQREIISLRKIDKVVVKGKEKPVEIYEIMKKAESDFIEEFNQGFELYQKGKFAKSREIFEKLIKEFDDGPSKVLLDRCNELITLKVKEWNGVWKWDEK